MSLVLTSRENKIQRITINRPEKRNALSIELCHDLLHALRAAEIDPQVSVILLDAAGDSFSAGMDLGEIAEPDFLRMADVHEELLTIGYRYSKPIVAAVQGAVFGGAVALAANAHVVVAAEDTKFCCTEIHIGIWPYVAFRAIEAAVGNRRAMELALTGRVALAQEAYEWGLVTQVVPQAKAGEVATRCAVAMEAFDGQALSQGVQFVNQSRGLAPEQAGMVARRFRERAFQSPTFQSAVRRFLEKR
ncbi:MAG: 2,3-dehydroadipyl-CoA hydratase [Anaerolineales bacterium]|nr:2,3-dehydroadipyl-CoA hydratase [Anaerolineales bacterium]